MKISLHHRVLTFPSVSLTLLKVYTAAYVAANELAHPPTTAAHVAFVNATRSGSPNFGPLN